MSRGPGRWQRAILDAIDNAPGEWRALDTIGPKCCLASPVESKATLTRSEVVARRRAAHTLADHGTIDLARRYLCRPGQRGTCALHVRRPLPPAQAEQEHANQLERLATLEQRISAGPANRTANV